MKKVFTISRLWYLNGNIFAVCRCVTTPIWFEEIQNYKDLNIHHPSHLLSKCVSRVLRNVLSRIIEKYQKYDMCGSDVANKYSSWHFNSMQSYLVSCTFVVVLNEPCSRKLYKNLSMVKMLIIFDNSFIIFTFKGRQTIDDTWQALKICQENILFRKRQVVSNQANFHDIECILFILFSYDFVRS